MAKIQYKIYQSTITIQEFLLTVNQPSKNKNPVIKLSQGFCFRLSPCGTTNKFQVLK